MLTGERRGVRRGMTVLGKIPAVPKPINLPSQRLENRGLDPNVELVPRGTVTWGNSARSPPTTSSPWGSSSQPSSPPVSAGAWGNTSSKPAPAAWGPNSTRPSSAGSTRPTSAGGTRPLSSGGPRPSSAGSRHLQDLPRPSSAGTREIPHTQNAWASLNSRPSSASGLGQPNNQPAETRPRSAESRSNSRVSLLSSEFSNAVQPWGPAARKLPEELPQPSRFTLTTGDFPTLGSEKNPSLRPQQRDRPGHPDDRSLTHEERPPPPSGTYQDDPYLQGPRLHDGDAGNSWGRDPFRGPPGMIERDGNYGMPSASSNSWRREGPHDLPDDDHWRGPPGGPYGPAGPPRFPNPEFVHQRFGPGPGSYGRGGHGQPGDGYGGFMRPMTPDRAGHHFGPGMFPGPYDGYYGYPGPNYNMEDREMMMWGGPGRYGGFQPGPPEFSRHPHGGMGPRPRQMPGHTGFGKDSEGFHSDHRDAGKLKEGENAGARTDGHNEFRRLQSGEPINKHVVNEPKRHMYGRPYGQRDWGNEEPMDFSKPVFEKEPSNNSSAKNHKVTFKAEPSVADVAILKKPQTIKTKTDDEDHGGVGMDHLGHTEDKSRDNEESNKGEEVRAVSNESIDKDKAPSRVDDAKDLGKLVEEKNVPDMSAGVLGKAPPTALGNNEMQGSTALSHVNNASKGLGDGPKHATEHIAVAAPHEQPVKEGVKSKFKPVVHDLEKEWRPKVQIADSKLMALKPSQSELSSPTPSAHESGDFENAGDVYDYEAQRAKMKEIAAQRARQLQKEEEERTKEQKAKALAKLEELNRKSAAISADVLAPSTPGEAEEVLGEKGSDDQLVPSDEVQSGTNVQEVKTSVGTPSSLSTKAEHGKRGDRKGNFRNRDERSKSHQRKHQDCAGENRMEPPLLPSPGVCQTQQQQEESQTAKPDVPQAPQTQQKQPRQRGKQHVLTAKGPEDVKPESPGAREQVESFSSLDTAAIDSDSAEIRAVNTSSAEPTTGNGPRRKKSNRSGKNRQKTEAGLSATSGLEKSSSGELHEESIVQPVGLKTLEKVATGMSSHSEGGESTTIEPADPADSLTLPEDRSSSRGNGERLGRKYQRKFQASKRTSKPQDVRVSDKVHAGEGMVWAPVRPNSGGSKSEGGPDLNEEKKHGSSSQQPTKSRRAEMERYTPKPVIKQQGQPQHAEKAHEENDDVSHEKHVRAVEGPGPEAYHKPGRGHVSWRQRSGSDRGAKDASESNENHPPANGSSKGLQQQRHEPEKFTQEQQSPKSATASGVAEKVASQAPTGRPNRSYPRQDHRYSNSPGMRKFDRSEDALPQNSGRLFISEGSRNKSGKQQHNLQQGPHWQPNDQQTQHDVVVSRSPNGPGRRQQQTDGGPPEILHAPVFRSHDKERQRENGMVYQQKSGSRQSQDIYQQEKVSDNHQKFPHQQGGPGYVQKASGTDVHKSQAQYQPVSQHPKSQGNSESWSSKADHSNAHWGGDVKDGRSREAGHSRRGRFGGRGGMRSVDLGNRVEKQRMVIDATGGAVPSQVVG